MTTDEITADTTFYALTAPVKGYRLEDQVLGSLTLREWLRKFNGQDAENDLACELYENLWFFTSEAEALDYKHQCHIQGETEAFRPRDLLNRLRLEAMEAQED